ncbi:MAG: PilX N-terminal domain-containing pilus assembly protein [Pseudomonadota bacterium]
MNTRLIQIRRQNGAALVVGLVLLLILTLLGVSGLGTATTEVRLADNNKQREFAFQAAESGVNEAILSGGLIAIDGTEVENTLVRNNSEYTYDHQDAAQNQAAADIRVVVSTAYRGVGDVPASEGGAAFDSNYSAIHFVAHGEATGGRGARAAVRRGFYIPGPTP